MRRLTASPWIRAVDRDISIAIADTLPNDPFFPQEWGLMHTNYPDIDAPQAWDITRGSSLTRVAVIDTGIDYKHPDLYLNVALNQAEIPTSLRAGLIDTNADGQLDFHDLNSRDANGATLLNSNGLPVNGWAAVDRNATGYIDGGDLLADPVWCNLQDNDANGYRDDLIGWNFYANSNNPIDEHSHGTHVTGTIAAMTNNGLGIAGVSWNSRIIPLRYASATGAGSTSHAISAIQYATTQKVDVINASWGTGLYQQAMRDAILAAGEAGSIFVAAAGNYSSDNDLSPFYPASYDLPHILSVAAVNEYGSITTFSNFGLNSVDLGAPGQSIYSTIPGGYGYKSGTSMAAPHASGVAALLVGQYPRLTPCQILDMITISTQPLPSLGGKTVTGGMLNAHQALLATPPPPNPPPPPVLATPTNLAAVALSRSSIQLTWTAAPGAQGYKIERSLNGTAWFPISQVGATTSFTDSGLSANTIYYYRISATYPEGDSDYTSKVSARTRKR